MFSIPSPFRSKNDNAKAAATPKANNQQQPGTPASATLQQVHGNQKIAAAAQQSGTTTTGDASTPEQTTDSILEASIESIYTNELYMPIKLAVLSKFGVGRGEWRRSKELNKFRQTLKDAARAQANEEITNQVSSHDELKQKGKSGQEYYGAVAKKKAHSLSKGSVDAIMEKEAIKIVNSELPKTETKKELKAAATTQVAKVQPISPDKIHKAALTGAQMKAIEILKETETRAVNKARILTKGDKQIAQPTPNKEQPRDFTSDVKTQVTNDKIAEKAIKLAIESDSLDSGLVRIGSIIDLAVPNNGDSGAFSFELKFPLGQSGGYVILSFGAEAGRDDDKLNVSAQIGLGIGFGAAGIDVNAQIGLYMEAEANNSKSVMNLISYGMYRHVNSTLPSVAEGIWGMGGESGKSTAEEAELWASAIEAQDMTEENYVDVGTFKQLSAEVKAGIAGISLGLGKKELTHFDREAIIEKTGNSFGDDTKFNQLGLKTSSLSKLEKKEVYQASGEVELDLGFGSLTLSAEGAATFFKGSLRNIEVSIGASIPFQYGEQAAKCVTYVSKIATPALGLLTTVNNALTSDKNTSAPSNANPASTTDAHNAEIRGAGTAVDVTSDAMILLPQFDEIGNSLAKQIQETDVDTGEIENKIAIISSTNLTFNFEKEWDQAGAPGDWKLSVELGQTKSIEVDAGIVKFSLEKTKKLAEFGRENKNGTSNFVGSFLGS